MVNMIIRSSSMSKKGPAFQIHVINDEKGGFFKVTGLDQEIKIDGEANLISITMPNVKLT
jgi:hypothetical protein